MLSVFSHILAWYDLNSAIEANNKLDDRCTVVLSMGPSKRFFLMRDKYSIGSINPNMCLCELVLNDTSRPFLDFDEDVENIIDVITSCLSEYFLAEYGVDVCISWKWSKLVEKRWHCIVSGIYFDTCWREGCLSMSNALKSRICNLNIDDSVYRYNSCLRMVYQCKYVGGIYMKKLLPHCNADLKTLFITHDDEDIPVMYNNPRLFIADSNINNTLQIKRVSTYVHDTFSLPDGLRFDKVLRKGDDFTVVRLSRYTCSMCILCRRIHANENAYIIVRRDEIEYRCFRKPMSSNGEEITICYKSNWL